MKTLLPEPSLKTYIDDTVITVFDTMLAMEVGPSDEGARFRTKETQVIGVVGLAGTVRAAVCLRVPEGFSYELTRAMTGARAGEQLSDADVNDVIGELTNIIAGKLKSCFRTIAGPCNLSLPAIARGRHIDLESISGTERHSFTFQLPRDAVVVEFYSLSQEEDTAMKIPQVLLIDDSRATRSIVARMLLTHECTILEAANGALGLESARAHQPDLIILDMTMPVMDGVETLRALQADETLRAIPVIMLSANSNPEEMVQMKALGAADYITKTQKPRLILDRAIALIGLQPKADTLSVGT